MIRRILVTGAGGQLGRSLARIGWPDELRLDLATSADLDVADEAAVAARLADGRHAAVINAAAYTAVDKAESDSEAAFRVNSLGAGILARQAAIAAIPLFHISTDYVFDGSQTGAYREEDPVGPIGVYGASKLAGERAVATEHPRATIIRTAWVVSPFGGNFVKTMLRLGGERSELRVVDDQIGCPTSALDLARAIRAMLLRRLDDANAPVGLYHFVNAGSTSWCGFAREIFVQASARGGPSPRVTAIATADYPTPARRPANSCLSVEKLSRDYAIEPRPWRDALAEIIAELVPVREEQSS
jgi:dTDP-4-dehydrorhamnose reductase